ncbi:TetR/AcrR family transcriptional regulator [Phycicoccus ginsengisoli]
MVHMKSDAVKGGVPPDVADRGRPDGAERVRPDGRSERWRAHREERRREFVQAAVTAIRQHGPRIGLDDVCAVAGVSKPVVYRHFKDKDDLFRAVLEFAAEDVFLPRLVQALETGSADDRAVVASAVRAYVATVREDRDLYRFAFAHNGLGDGGDFVGGVESAVAQALVALLATRRGEPADDDEHVAYAVVGLVQLATHRWLDRPTIPEDRLVELLTSLAWEGLAPKVSPPA